MLAINTYVHTLKALQKKKTIIRSSDLRMLGIQRFNYFIYKNVSKLYKQDENKWSLQVQKFIVKQSHQALTSELSRYYLTAVKVLNQSMYMQLQWFVIRGTAVKETNTSANSKSVLWFNKTKYVIWVQWCYWTEFQVDLPSRPSIQNFTNRSVR